MASSRPQPARSTVSIGRAGERRVRLHYRLRGYRILAANVRSGGVEVDLVARRGGKLVFCEVKTKGSGRFGDPLEMVDRRKQERLARAAEAWLAQHADARGLELSFEVVALRGRRLERVRNAF